MGEVSGTVYASVLSHHNRTLQELDGLDNNVPGVQDMGTTQRLAQALQRNRRHQMASQMAAVANTYHHHPHHHHPPPPQQFDGQHTADFESSDDVHQQVADIPSSSTAGSTSVANFSGLSATELALFKRIQAADDTTSHLDSVAHSVDTPAGHFDEDSDDEFEAQVVTIGPQKGPHNGAEREIVSIPQRLATDGSAGGSSNPSENAPVTCSSNEADDADISAARDAVREAAEAFANMHGFSYGGKPSQGGRNYGEYGAEGAGWSLTHSTESTAIPKSSGSGPANEALPNTSSLSSFGLLESSLQKLSTGFRPTSTPAPTGAVGVSAESRGSASIPSGSTWSYRDDPSPTHSDDQYEMHLASAADGVADGVTRAGSETDGSGVSSSSTSASRAWSIEQALEQAHQMLDIG